MHTHQIRFLLASLLLMFFAHTSMAQSRIGEFTNSRGWAKGQTSPGFALHGIDVSMEVQGSYNDGKLYYVISFTNDSSVPFSGGARIGQTRPEKTFFAMNLKPGQTKTWGEHLPAGLTTVYVLLRKHETE